MLTRCSKCSYGRVDCDGMCIDCGSRSTDREQPTREQVAAEIAARRTPNLTEDSIGWSDPLIHIPTMPTEDLDELPTTAGVHHA